MFLLSRLWARVLFDFVAYACDYVCEFWGRNYVKGEGGARCETLEKFYFFEKKQNGNLPQSCKWKT